VDSKFLGAKKKLSREGVKTSFKGEQSKRSALSKPGKEAESPTYRAGSKRWSKTRGGKGEHSELKVVRLCVLLYTKKRERAPLGVR